MTVQVAKVFPELADRMTQLVHNRRAWQERHLAHLDSPDNATPLAERAAERVRSLLSMRQYKVPQCNV